MMDAEERQTKKNERTKQLRERELNDVKKLVRFPEGRRFLWRIMSLAETFQNTPCDKRTIGLTVFNDIMEAQPEIFIQMQREYKSEQVSFEKQFPVEEEEL